MLGLYANVLNAMKDTDIRNLIKRFMYMNFTDFNDVSTKDEIQSSMCSYVQIPRNKM
jgi:hypothetical protein